MNITRYRNTLIAAAVAAALGLGATACSKTPDYSSTDAQTDAQTDARSTSSGSMIAMKTTADDAQDAMSDTWITTKVKSSLLADSDAKGFDVNVETKAGVVTLRGELDDQAAISHVKNIAAGVEGVKSVNTTAMTVSDRR